MNQLLERFDKLTGRIMGAVQQAASEQSVEELGRLAHLAKETKSMREHLVLLERRLAELEKGIVENDHKPVQVSSNWPTGTLRELRVEVTQGMINQNLLTLTDHVNVGRVQPGEDFTIEAKGSDEQFRTPLLANGNKLQERGAVGRFYRHNSVKPGDVVLLKETSPNRWVLQTLTHRESAP